MTALQLILFAAFWVIAIYAFYSVLAKGFKKIDPKAALLYISTVAMIGVVGEVFVGTLYEHLFDKPLWHYTVLPIHNAYTSYYSLVIWGAYGFYLYLLHGHLNGRSIHRTKHLALIFSVEAVIVEALVNITFLAAFGQYLYYYFPGDLWHLTSVQTLPFYLLAGFLIAGTLRRFKSDPAFFTAMSAALSFVLVFLA